MPYVIRPMREADLPGRAAVHCRAWEETYRGQIPDVVLDGMTPEAIEAAVRALPMETLVVEGAEGIVGFACFCPEARAFTGRRNTSEIAALYLLRSVQGLGLGRRLMEAVLAVLPHREVILHVLEGNTRAIQFYEHMGFSPTCRTVRQETAGGAMVELEMLLHRQICSHQRSF